MKWSDLPLKPTARALRQFAGAWLIFFLAVGVYRYLARGQHQIGLAVGAMAVVVGCLGLIKPAAVRWLFVGATLLAFPIGWVVSQVMPGVMYYCIVQVSCKFSLLTHLVGVVFCLLGWVHCQNNQAVRAVLPFVVSIVSQN